MEAPADRKTYDNVRFEGDLARINVLRLRGDAQVAKQLCRELLLHKPESEQAHALMGELCMDNGEFNEAADWFEMAASHAPDSGSLKTRAEQARRRVEEVEALATARKLGIPTSRSKMHIFAGTLLVIVLAVCALAFYIGGQLGQGNRVRTINTPLTLSPAPATATTSPTEEPALGFALPAADDRLLKALQGSSTLGARTQLAYRDPRGPTLVVSLEAPPGEFTTRELASDAATILNENIEAAAVTIRYLRGGEPLAMAKMTRARLDAAVAANRSTVTALEDVWPDVEPPKTEKPSSNETQGGSPESVPVPVPETTSGP